MFLAESRLGFASRAIVVRFNARGAQSGRGPPCATLGDFARLDPASPCDAPFAGGQGINPVPAVNPLGAFWSNISTRRMNAARFIPFRRGLMRLRRPVFPLGWSVIRPTAPRPAPLHPIARGQAGTAFSPRLRPRSEPRRIRLERHAPQPHVENPTPQKWVTQAPRRQ